MIPAILIGVIVVAAFYLADALMHLAFDDDSDPQSE
jgi:hypothetical protein